MQLNTSNLFWDALRSSLPLPLYALGILPKAFADAPVFDRYICRLSKFWTTLYPPMSYGESRPKTLEVPGVVEGPANLGLELRTLGHDIVRNTFHNSSLPHSLCS